MSDLPPAHAVIRAKDIGDRVPHDVVVLGYDERMLRRKRLMTVHDQGFLVDLASVTSADHLDCFELMDGRLIQVIAAEEPVLVVTGDLPRLAWHIGNRHTPCQVDADRLVIRDDHVLKAMLIQLGATVTHAMEPFTPEGGAYGHGRTMGHDHGGHDHGPAHSHAHVVPLGHALGGLHIHHHASRAAVEDDELDEAE